MKTDNKPLIFIESVLTPSGCDISLYRNAITDRHEIHIVKNGVKTDRLSGYTREEARDVQKKIVDLNQ